MHSQYFNENYLKLAKKAETNLKETLDIIQLFIGNFEAKTEFYQEQNNKRENNLNMPVISYKGENEEVKFQGKTIHKNKKCNTWYTRYRLDGKQYYISGKTQKEVLLELKNQLNYVKKEKKKTLTLLDWYNQWLELFKIGRVKESTLYEYKSIFNHIPEKLLNKNIKEITSIEIQKLINTITGNRVKQKVYDLLKSIFIKAEQNNICKNILTVIDKPRHKKENGIALTNEDRMSFENYCLENKEYVFLITLYQGLRKGEVLGITKEDIDIKNNTLRINKTFNIRGKFDTTKNITSNRIIPLFNISKQIFNKIDLDKNTRIFNYDHTLLQSKFRKIIDILNLNPKYTIHSLRHTFITYCQDNNIPEHIIQSWVGHTIGSKITSTVYTHVQKDTNEANILILNNSKFYSNSTHD